MPTRPLRPCAQPGCPAIATAGGRCAAHQRESRRPYDAGRESASQRGYGVGWRRNRGRFLKHNPACAACGADATEVDHIVPKAQGGSDEWDNLQALCKSCHSRKTATVDGGGWRDRTGEG